jgi:predicted transcriptional regulator
MITDNQATPQTSETSSESKHRNAELFLAAFNQIERYLTTSFDSTHHLGFKRLVDRLSKENSLVALYKQDLIEFLELRNAIVHQSTGLPIAEPSDEVVVRIQELQQKLTHPPQAIDIATKPVYSCDVQDNIAEVVRTMHTERYIYVPVYSNQEFVGVFSENTLTKWLANIATVEGFVIREQIIGDVIDFLDQSDDKYNAYTFVAKDIDAFTIRDKFLSYLSDRKRLSAIFVTAHGSPQEEILGIITAWDIHKLSHLSSPYHHAR